MVHYLFFSMRCPKMLCIVKAKISEHLQMVVNLCYVMFSRDIERDQWHEMI